MNSITSNLIDVYKNANSVNKISEVSTKLINIGKDKNANAYKNNAWNVAEDFVSLFTNFMLKEMRKSLHEENNPLYGGFAQELWSDMLYEEYSKKLTKNGLQPLTQMVYQSLGLQNQSNPLE